jgi:hypothetical protein
VQARANPLPQKAEYERYWKNNMRRGYSFRSGPQETCLHHGNARKQHGNNIAGHGLHREQG